MTKKVKSAIAKIMDIPEDHPAVGAAYLNYGDRYNMDAAHARLEDLDDGAWNDEDSDPFCQALFSEDAATDLTATADDDVAFQRMIQALLASLPEERQPA